MTDANDLSRLFAEATADVRPQGTYDDILNRTEKVDPMARRWFLPTIAAAAVMALVIGGAFWITQRSDSPAAGPATSASTAPFDNRAVPVSRAVPVYYVGDAAQGPRLFREFLTLQICPGDACLLEQSVRQAVDGDPEDPDYRNPWPEGTSVAGTSVTDGVISVDLSPVAVLTGRGDFDLFGEPMRLAVQQLVYSAQAGYGQGRLPVQLLINGEPAGEPLAAAEELDVLAPVQITSPSNNQTFPAGDVTVTGVAAVFEANVLWELLVGGDAVVKSGFATAQECCTMSPYEFVLEDLEPGTYTLVVHDEDMSGEGRPINQDTRDITIE